MASTDTPERRRFGWTGVLGLLISVVLLWWTLRDIHPREVAAHLASVRWVPFLASVVIATLVFPLRTVRWRYILRLDGEVLPFVPLWHATAIGFMANNLLPARTGEVARVYAASRLTQTRFSAVATTLVVERIMDGLILVALLTLVLSLGGFSTETVIGGVTIGRLVRTAVTIFGIILGVAIAVVHWPESAMRLARRIAGLILPVRWATNVLQVLDGVLQGLGVLRDWRRFAAVTGWSFVVWGINGISFLLLMVAFEFQIPWTAAYVLQTLIAFGVSVPSTPGFFGPFEAVTRATLTAYGISPDLAVSYAVAYHLPTFIPITLLGLWSLSRAHLALNDLRRSPADGEPEGG